MMVGLSKVILKNKIYYIQVEDDNKTYKCRRKGNMFYEIKTDKFIVSLYDSSIVYFREEK